MRLPWLSLLLMVSIGFVAGQEVDADQFELDMDKVNLLKKQAEFLQSHVTLLQSRRGLRTARQKQYCFQYLSFVLEAVYMCMADMFTIRSVL